MLQIRLDADYRHGDDVLDLLPKLVNVCVLLVLTDVLKHSRQRPFVPCAVLVLVFIELEGIALLLNRVVSQVHEQVVDVLRVVARGLVGLGREPGETFLVHKDSQRVHSIDQGVDSEVKLEPVNQVGVV